MINVTECTPRQRYESDLAAGDLLPDTAQAKAVDYLQALYDDLVARELQLSNQSWGKRLSSWFRSEKTEPVMGLYFWGGVGRGKTYLMDAFYDSLPFEQKLRSHFHRFMQLAHQKLRKLDGEKNPLEIVADEIADSARVICFDEFFVSDITDAMILGGLMQHLFARGTTLVATSNIVPQELYKDGLQRQRFLPAIELIQRYTQVVNIDGGVDYRLRVLEQAEIYHSPLDASAYPSLLKSFLDLAPDHETITDGEIIEIEGRGVATIKCDDDVVWFEFAELCDGPRSQNDYIEIAKMYHAVLISNVPQFTPDKDDQARRFISMIDEFYDRNVKLIVSAEMPIDQLYQGSRLKFEFERTQSRLLEMQSHDYLARGHKP